MKILIFIVLVLNLYISWLILNGDISYKESPSQLQVLIMILLLIESIALIVYGGCKIGEAIFNKLKENNDKNK